MSKDLTYRELKNAVEEASDRKDKWVLKQLARGLSAPEITNHPAYDIKYQEILLIIRQNIGENVTVQSCRKALFQHIASGKTTEEDAKYIIGHEVPK